MTVVVVPVELLPGEPERVDGLCPTCLLPALWRVSISAVYMGGIRDYGMVEFCEECNTNGR
jgi:hypothetical protein